MATPLNADIYLSGSDSSDEDSWIEDDDENGSPGIDIRPKYDPIFIMI